MQTFLVDVTILGRIRVNAEDEAGAKSNALRAGLLGLSFGGDAKVFNPVVHDAVVYGPMQNHTVQPVTVHQKITTTVKS